ncbi:extracellular solute-binding protein [Paenibacillus doosanensis]|uniref:extracellular solute-binding protein n=1 Tax=Paenibacillus doosanensis TaxID=1229154 RepID=UPI00217F968C|nr:extracellular solute-binding protein [Paenibacillus doosanensis]MCS7462917.1 extracellular solute-binding protein [Paenibacillus doosanensis]
MASQMNRLRKPVLSLTVAGLMVAAGCSGGTDKPAGQEKAADTGKSQEPFKITMMNQSIVAEPPRPDDPVIAAIEKYTNTKLEIQWVPGTTYTDKLNATIAAGSLPMVVLLQSRPQTVINAIRSGYFWEIGPYLKDYPNLERSLNKQVLKNVSLDGKLYSIFRSRALVGDGVIFRKDWLDNLGMKAPTNIDELYNTIKAFTLNDPDKNGKNDTIGFAEEMSLRGFNFLLAAFGGGNQWDVKDGKLQSVYFSQAYLDTLSFYRKLYQEKLMNQDFALATRPQNIDNMDKGQYGMRMGDPDQITRHSQLFKSNPKAQLEVTSTLNGKNGVRVLMDTGYTGEFVFPKSSVKTEAQLRQILAYFDKISEDAGQNIFEWGLEGVHYTMQNGKPARSQEQQDKYNSEVIQLEQTLQVSDGSRAVEGVIDPYVKKYKDAKNAVANNLVPNPAASYTSDTLNQKSAELNKMINDARVKYIMGQLDEAGWKSVLDSWSKAGGDKVTQELNEQYAKDPNK